MPVPGFIKGVNSCLDRKDSDEPSFREVLRLEAVQRAPGICELSLCWGGFFGDTTTCTTSLFRVNLTQAKAI